MIADSKMSTHQPRGVLHLKDFINRLVLSYEQMDKRWPVSLLNNKEIRNWFGVEHQPVKTYSRKRHCYNFHGLDHSGLMPIPKP